MASRSSASQTEFRLRSTLRAQTEPKKIFQIATDRCKKASGIVCVFLGRNRSILGQSQPIFYPQMGVHYRCLFSIVFRSIRHRSEY